MDKRDNRIPDRPGKMERICLRLPDRHDNLHSCHLQNRNTIFVNDNFMAYFFDNHCPKKGKKITWSIAHSLLSLPGENH